MTANRSPVPVSTVVVRFVSATVGVVSDTVTVGGSGGGEYPEPPVSVGIDRDSQNRSYLRR